MQAVEPQIAELLRTTIHPPSLLLRVAHVEFVQTERYHAESFTSNSENEKPSSIKKNGCLGKFLLSDGELMIQALLHRKSSGLKDAGNIAKGDLIDIRRFTVNKSPRLNGRGKIIFLGIEDCTFLLNSSAEDTREEGSVRQTATSNAPTKKRARIDEEEQPAHTKNNANSRLEVESIAQPTPKRARMSFPEKDDVLLPSSIPSTPPLSAGGLNEFFALQDAGNIEKARVLTPTTKRTVSHSSKRTSTKRSSDPLSRSFGARTILPDDDDSDDFFEPIQAIRTPAKVAESAFRKSLYSPGAYLKQGNDNASDSFSSGLIRAKPSKASEPQLPPQPISRRDGTFALSQNMSFYQARIDPPRQTTTPQQQRPKTAPSKSTMAQSDQNLQPSLLPAPPFYTLQALRHPPPTQSLPKNNVTVTVLAVVSWLGTSLLHRAGSPFPPKRHLKIVDPSLTSSRPESRDNQLQVPANIGALRPSNATTTFKPQTTFQDSVTVAVYIDAADFKPSAGTIALFRGLVMQRLANGDIILNAYGRLKDQQFAYEVVENGIAGQQSQVNQEQRNNFSHWYITDPDMIRALGYGGKMDYYREWWNKRQLAT